jgi:hypothetical protein
MCGALGAEMVRQGSGEARGTPHHPAVVAGEDCVGVLVCCVLSYFVVLWSTSLESALQMGEFTWVTHEGRVDGIYVMLCMVGRDGSPGFRGGARYPSPPRGGGRWVACWCGFYVAVPSCCSVVMQTLGSRPCCMASFKCYLQLLQHIQAPYQPPFCCSSNIVPYCLQAHGQARWWLWWPQPTTPPLTLATRQGRGPQPTTPCGWPQEPQPSSAQEPSASKGESCVTYRP